MPTLLITGHSGFVGQTLLAEAARGAFGGSWRIATFPTSLDISGGNVRDAVVHDVPDAVIHLAALTSVAGSFENPDRYFEVNFGGTLALLRALREGGFRGRFLHVSSGDCYGVVEDSRLPVSEEQPLRPRSPYAVSKVASEALCYQWSQTEGLDAVIARPFNHIGPGQEPRFVVAALARQVARIALGHEPPVVRAGDLEVTRDFTDVRDVIRGYAALLARGRRGEVYNIGSGREVRVADLVRQLQEIAGVRARVEIDPSRLRANEQRRLVADVRKIAGETGWAPRFPLDETLRATIEFWKAKER